MNLKLVIYLIPPLLTLIAGLFLALLGFSNRKQFLFSLVCLWFVLLPPIFILHPFVKDPAAMLTIERWFHFFYVYFPLIHVLFTHDILNIRRNKLTWSTAALSFIASLSVPTDLYFTGFNYFGWGYIAKGGIAFSLFGLYGVIVFAYCFYCFFKKLKNESNYQLRLKYQYLMFAFGLSSLLTVFNVVSISGIDLYPTSNFTFIPLSILAYGIFKHRMLDARTILRRAGVWSILAILIMTPQYLLLRWLWPSMQELSTEMFFWTGVAWFLPLYFYGRLVFKMVWYLFYRQRQNLKQTKKILLKQMPVLGNADDLIGKVTGFICKIMPFAWAKVYLFDAATGSLSANNGYPIALKSQMQQWLMQSVRMIEMSVLSLQFNDKKTAAQPQALLQSLQAEYLLPLLHDDRLVGVLVMPSKSNKRQITPDETRFFMEIVRTFSLSLFNAMMYQHVLALKEDLQARTLELTQEMEERDRAEKKTRTLQQELENANYELERAILQANQMTAKAEIGNYVLEKEMENRKRIEEELRQSEERYRLIADNATDVIWTIDMQNRFTYLSPSVRHLLGYSSEEMLQFDISKVLTPESLQKATQVILEELELGKKIHSKSYTHKSRTMEVEQVHKDGTVIWTEVNTRFIRDDNRKIIGILGVTRDISGRKKSEQELIHMAYHDALTGLFNRKAFYEQLEKDIKYARRYNTSLTLLLFDLNKFKQINDTHGHQTGDLLLKAVAERLVRNLRETDQIARLGGDEFTIILKSPDKTNVNLVVQKIMAELSSTFLLDGIEINDLSASIGTATFPADGQRVDELVRSADAAMYTAKRKRDACA